MNDRFGELTPIEFQMEVRKITERIEKLLHTKRLSYGPGNLTRHGEAGIIVRMGDKMQRLDNHAGKLMRGEGGNATHVDGETIEDAYMDMIGYCVLALIYRGLEG